MKFTVHAEHPPAFLQALHSASDGIRYGADLCEFKLPNDHQLKDFLGHINESDKEFSYVCPRLPEKGFSVIDRHLAMISTKAEKPIRVIANDWGVINVLVEQRYPNLIPYLGRQLVAIPNRGRPSMAQLMAGEGLLKRFAVQKMGGIIFNKTNLHFKSTQKFLRAQGVEGADIDWVPATFGGMKEIVKAGLKFSAHLGLVIVAVVRRCHTARYFDEPIPESCSMPCFKTAFLLKHEIFGDLYMDGNTIFAKSEPTSKELQQFFASGPSELVLTMGPMTKIQTSQDIDDRILQLKTHRSTVEEAPECALPESESSLIDMS